MTEWTKAAKLAAVPESGMRRVEHVGAQGHHIVLARSGGRLYAFAADCPHAGAPLERGALCNDRIVCPWHKSVFALDGGAVLEPPALAGLRAYPVKTEGADVYVDLQAPAPAPGLRERNALRRFAIVGGGAAAAAAAATLLESGFDGELHIYTEESEAPYDRTCLSKFVPAGEMSASEVPGLLPDLWARSPRLQMEHVAVAKLDTQLRQITLPNGREASFDAVLIASGSVPQRLEIPGADLGRVFTLRNVRDAQAIFDALSPGEHAVMIGDSFISLETASALRKRDVRVSIVSRTGVPLSRAIGARMGVLFRDWHEAHGVEFHRATAVRFEGESDVQAVQLDNGSTLPAQAVIVGVGVRPATQFVDGLALDADGGVSVDASMRAAPGIYAAGDIARFALRDGSGVPRTVRIEHWRMAQQHARVAALNMLGHEARYEGVPYFWTVHYGKRIDALGLATQWDDITVSGTLADERFCAVYSRLGRVQAVLACGYERETARLIEQMREPVATEIAHALLGCR
ncbi:FAD-dependent oxidoreductase [Paraburkholderia tagetis]|uniref:FAD-dependent oxidoreductase n=1 Tax=Paraburkholderia tagetis TaxID=2913261 RepID=A0A9X1UG72_9BURK|nr:FAD-dependent oxidoreductase [Paraburkholderia tagetis]MCG5075130.1 FAD-dependent oxidoreductase [Paraburkholderia tagetis]